MVDAAVTRHRPAFSLAPRRWPMMTLGDGFGGANVIVRSHLKASIDVEVGQGDVRGMSRSLLNIEKRSLAWLTLRGVGLASKNAM